MTGPLIVCYHAIADDWPGELAVRPAAFERQIAGLLRRGWRAMTFSEVVTGATGRRALAITFDDAFASVHERALPILRRLGAPATVFAPTAFVGASRPMSWPGIDHWSTSPQRDELQCMSWEQLRELDAAGWEIGSHTRSHPLLTALDDEALAAELEGSRHELQERLEAPCRSLAYPYGDRDARVVEAARAAGYAAGAGLPDRPHAPLLLDWPRVGIYRGDGGWRLRAKLSPGVAELRRRLAA